MALEKTKRFRIEYTASAPFINEMYHLCDQAMPEGPGYGYKTKEKAVEAAIAQLKAGVKQRYKDAEYYHKQGENTHANAIKEEATLEKFIETYQPATVKKEESA